MMIKKLFKVMLFVFTISLTLFTYRSFEAYYEEKNGDIE